MLSSINIFFHTKGLRIQHVLSQSSQVIFALCGKVENHNNNDHESEDEPVLSQPS